jgi:hypothetical protein
MSVFNYWVPATASTKILNISSILCTVEQIRAFSKMYGYVKDSILVLTLCLSSKIKQQQEEFKKCDPRVQ